MQVLYLFLCLLNLSNNTQTANFPFRLSSISRINTGVERRYSSYFSLGPTDLHPTKRGQLDVGLPPIVSLLGPSLAPGVSEDQGDEVIGRHCDFEAIGNPVATEDADD